MRRYIQKLWSSRVNDVDGTTFIGDSNRLWYDSGTNTIRVHSGAPGGVVVAGAGGSLEILANGAPIADATALDFTGSGVTLG